MAYKGGCTIRELAHLSTNALYVSKWFRVVGSLLVYKRLCELLAWLLNGRVFLNVNDHYRDCAQTAKLGIVTLNTMCRSLHKCGIAHLDEAGLSCTAYNAIDPVHPLPAVPGDAVPDETGSDMDISSTSDMSVGYPPSAAASDAASVLGDSQPPSLSAEASSSGSVTSSRGGTSDHSSSPSSAPSHDSSDRDDSD